MSKSKHKIKVRMWDSESDDGFSAWTVLTVTLPKGEDSEDEDWAMAIHNAWLKKIGWEGSGEVEIKEAIGSENLGIAWMVTAEPGQGGSGEVMVFEWKAS